eukprot:5614026-Amphidinium_carterae.2
MCGMANICGPYVGKSPLLLLTWPGSGFSSFLWHQFKMGLIDLFEPSFVECAEFLHVERVVDPGTLLLMTTSTTMPSGDSWALFDILALRVGACPIMVSNTTQHYNRSGTLLDTEEDNQTDYVWADDLESLGVLWMEVADPSVLPFFAPVSVKWRRRVRLNPASYDPWTWYNCLFLSLSTHLWSKGATVLGANVEQWSRCYGTNPQTFLSQTTSRRWGSAPDAMILCRALNINLLIIDDFRVLVRQTVKRSDKWVVLRLVNSHYTVANHDLIRPAAYVGRDIYTVFNRAGREVQISHFSQFAMALSGGDAMHGDVMLGVTSVLLAPFLSCCPGRSKPEKRPNFLGEKKKCEEPYRPVGGRSRKDPPPTPVASWRTEDHSRSMLLWGLGGCWCSLFTFVIGYLWSTTITELWCGIAIDNTLVIEFVEFGSGRLFDLSWSSSLSSSCYSSSSLHWNVLWIGGMLQQIPQRAIHFDDPSDTQSFGMVQFQAMTLKAPDYNENEFLPLLFFMSGLEGLGGIRDTAVQAMMSSKRWPAGSLILVAPKSTHWWFSANTGAYAVTELLTTHQSVPARVVVLGGVHGHGDTEEQCRILGLPPKLQSRVVEFERKWTAYLYRLMSGPNVHADRFVVVHNTLDTLSYWQPASEIWNALDQSRIWAGASLLRRILFTRQASRAFKQGHNYWKLTFEEAIDELVALRVDPPLSEAARIEIVNDRLGSRLAAEPQNSFVQDSGGAYVVMMSLAPSSSLENLDVEDPIPPWALPGNLDVIEPQLRPSLGLVFDPTSGSSGSGSTSSSLAVSTSSSLVELTHFSGKQGEHIFF